MTTYSTGDVILVHFPFTELSSAKKRPAVVISPSAFSSRHGNVVVLALTSQSQTKAAFRLKHWKRSGLLKPTWVTEVIGTLHYSVVVRRLGKLRAADHACVKAALADLIAGEFLP